jgi:hypothetical protein
VIPDVVAAAWTEFLARYRWCWFATLTFRDETHPEAADKRFRVWVSKLNRALYGSRWYKHATGVHWARALEYQRRGVIHFHALLGGTRLEGTNRRYWEEEWFKLAGIARISPPRSVELVSRYAAKYTAKGGEIDIGGPLPDFSTPPLFAQLEDGAA